MIILKVAGQQFKVAECGFLFRVQFKRILKKRLIFTPTAISKDLNKIYKILINLELQNLPISLKKYEFIYIFEFNCINVSIFMNINILLNVLILT